MKSPAINALTLALLAGSTPQRTRTRSVSSEPKRNDMQSSAVEQHEKQMRRAARSVNDHALHERQKKWN